MGTSGALLGIKTKSHSFLLLQIKCLTLESMLEDSVIGVENLISNSSLANLADSRSRLRRYHLFLRPYQSSVLGLSSKVRRVIGYLAFIQVAQFQIPITEPRYLHSM